MQISPCVFPWLRSHFVKVLLDSCLGASLLRIEDGEVSQTLPLKVPQGARKLLWMSAGTMNATSKLRRLQAMGLICLMGLGMSLCTKLSADVSCPLNVKNPKIFVVTNFWGTVGTKFRAERKIVQNADFRRKRHDNQIMKVHILLLRNFVFTAQAPTERNKKKLAFQKLQISRAIP